MDLKGLIWNIDCSFPFLYYSFNCKKKLFSYWRLITWWHVFSPHLPSAAAELCCRWDRSWSNLHPGRPKTTHLAGAAAPPPTAAILFAAWPHTDPAGHQRWRQSHPGSQRPVEIWATRRERRSGKRAVRKMTSIIKNLLMGLPLVNKFHIFTLMYLCLCRSIPEKKMATITDNNNKEIQENIF